MTLRPREVDREGPVAPSRLRLGLALVSLLAFTGPVVWAGGQFPVTDPAGDVGPLPDCVPEGDPDAPPWSDLLAVDIPPDEDGFRSVEFISSGDLAAAVSAGPEARLELWISRDGETITRFVHGVQGGEPVDEVLDQDGAPLGVPPAAVEAAEGRLAMLISLEVLHQLGLLFGDAQFGAVAVSGGHCDKLGMRPLGGRLILLLGPFPAAQPPATTTTATTVGTTTPAATTSTTGAGTTTPSGGGLSPYLWVGLGALVLLTIVFVWLRHLWPFGNPDPCKALGEECRRLRRALADAENAVDTAEENLDKAEADLAAARQAHAEAQQEADAAEADPDSWRNRVWGEEGTVTEGDLRLREEAAREIQEALKGGEITPEQAREEWRKLGGEEARQRRREEHAKAARAAEQAAGKAKAAAEAAAAGARDALPAAKEARDAARRAADEACHRFEDCIEERDGTPPPRARDDLV